MLDCQGTDMLCTGAQHLAPSPPTLRQGLRQGLGYGLGEGQGLGLGLPGL
jgi:hypothetical protein